MNLSEQYESEIFGTLGTDTYRVFFKKSLFNVGSSSSTKAKVYISPFHDIPLYSEEGTNIYRMVVRMSRWTNARMEICKTEPFNPIKHDSRKKTLKYIENIFPYHGVIWNYGSFPQTWEMESYQNPDFEGFKGDNSPMDVIEIGSRIHLTGDIVNVKVLGGLVLLDQDHLDWKIIAIDINDQLASKIEDILDLKEYMPGLLESISDWLKFYKVPMGQSPIKFGYDNSYFDKTIAYEAIERSHKFWKMLIKDELLLKQSKDCEKFMLLNTQCIDCVSSLIKSDNEAEEIIENLKSLIIERPVESMAQAPSKYQIEKIYYLNKQDLLKKVMEKKQDEGKDSEKKEQDKEKEQNSFFKFCKDNFVSIAIPVSICVVLVPLIYYKLKSSDSNLK